VNQKRRKEAKRRRKGGHVEGDGRLRKPRECTLAKKTIRQKGKREHISFGTAGRKLKSSLIGDEPLSLLA